MKLIIIVSNCNENVLMPFSCPRIKIPRNAIKNPRNSDNQAIIVICMLRRLRRHRLAFVLSVSKCLRFTIDSLCSLTKKTK